MAQGPRSRGVGEPGDVLASLDIAAGQAVILYLHTPKEKVWGVLLSIGVPGVVTRCIELNAFDEWLRQEARGEEPGLGLSTVFYPMHRIERMERDETVGGVEGYADRFAREVGRSVFAVLEIEAAD
ncbi:MAG TPA: hypothetical protein VFM29_01435 [Vicinamibacteria bacterium]|nr:hypothetical protein [Vicinamibacteria bacterium]